MSVTLTSDDALTGKDIAILAGERDGVWVREVGRVKDEAIMWGLWLTTVYTCNRKGKLYKSMKSYLINHYNMTELLVERTINFKTFNTLTTSILKIFEN